MKSTNEVSDNVDSRATEILPEIVQKQNSVLDDIANRCGAEV